MNQVKFVTKRQYTAGELAQALHVLLQQIVNYKMWSLTLISCPFGAKLCCCISQSINYKSP